jgi:diazepam-binding inhibitor (GABA receptor modulating acyl-CoA-binding protein)|uniref:ACB domain-containing protein n=1 Tax=viral metagenome TaxID=1070528 RepID=A0A6C0I832_9ZZZZ
MSTNINDIFNQAANDASKLVGKVDDDTLLQVYGFYKQATLGDNNTEKPSFFNFKASKKWESWDALKGMSKLLAQGQYIKLIKDLIAKHNL